MAKILIVEDSAPMRALIRLMVALPEDEVRECADGTQALGAYTKFQPEWVTMDIDLGRTDGLTATREIKSLFPRARIMILTQHDNEVFRAAAANAGAWAYVLKDNLSCIRKLFTGELPADHNRGAT